MAGEINNNVNNIDLKGRYLHKRFDHKANKMKNYALFLSHNSTMDSHPFLDRVEIPEGTIFGNAKEKKKTSHTSDTNITPNWKVSVYNEDRAGASTIFNYGESKNKQSVSFSTDVLFGLKITEEDNKGLFFDANVGVRYDVGLEKSTPNRHRGGVVGELTLGYKMPVYESKNFNITFDNYATGGGYYCNSGHNGLDSLERSGFVSGAANEESFKKEPYLRSQLFNYLLENKIDAYGDRGIFLNRTNFDGSTTLYNPYDLHSPSWLLPSGGGKAKDPRLNPYGLKGGVGSGVTFNIKPDNTGDNQLSIYLGLEAGVHKTGPKFEIDHHDTMLFFKDEKYFERYKDKPIYVDSLNRTIIVDNGKFDKSSEYYFHYESNVHEKLAYISGKFNLNYSWDLYDKPKTVFLNVDEHGAFVGFKANLFSTEFDGNTKSRPR